MSRLPTKEQQILNVLRELVQARELQFTAEFAWIRDGKFTQEEATKHCHESDIVLQATGRTPKGQNALLAVFCSPEEKVGKGSMESYHETLGELAEEQDAKVVTAIIIVPQSDYVTSQASEFIKSHPEYEYQVFAERELMFNINKHAAVMAHKRLSDTEALKVRQRYKGAKFPKLLRSDPVAKFHGWRKGDIIQVTRNYGGAQDTYNVYRVVA